MSLRWVAPLALVLACSSAAPNADDLSPSAPARRTNPTEPAPEPPPLYGDPAPETPPELEDAGVDASSDANEPEPEPEPEPAPVDAGPTGPTCTSTCSTVNAKRCASGSTFETCKQVQPGCLKWQSATACGAGMTCTGAGSCSCAHQCTTGSDACVTPTQFKSCVTNANGCRVWSTPKDCVRATSACFATPTACFGKCNDACSTVGTVTCSGPSSYVECVRGPDGCNEIETGACKTSTVCFASPGLCANGQ